jgi:hypothetical protein
MAEPGVQEEPDRLQLLLEAERRGMLPDDMKPLLSEARRRGLVPATGSETPEGETDEQRYRREVDTEARRRVRERPLGYTGATVGEMAGLGFTPEILATVNPFRRSWRFERDVVRRQFNIERGNLGLGTLPGDIAGGLLMAPARAGQVFLGNRVFTPPATAAASYGRQLYDASRVGAAFGATYGFGSAESGNLEDRISGAFEHGVGGAIAGPLLRMSISAAGAVAAPFRNAYRAWRAETGNRARTVEAELQAAGIPDFTPAGGGSLVRGSALGLSRTFLGSPVRRGARETIEALEQRILEQLERSGGGVRRTAAEAGDEAQAFLRRTVVERSRPHAEVENLPLEELQSVASGASDRLLNRTSGRVERLRHDQERIADEHNGILAEMEQAIRNLDRFRTGRTDAAGRPGYRDVPERHELERRLADLDRRRARLRSEYERLDAEQARLGRDQRTEPTLEGRRASYPTAFDAAYEDLRRQAPEVSPKILGVRMPQRERPVPKPRTEGRYPETEIEDIVAAWEAAIGPQGVTAASRRLPETLSQFIRARGGIRDTQGEVRAMIGGITGHGRLINNRRGLELDEIGELAHQAGFFQQRPSPNELLAALDDDLRGNPMVRLSDQDALMALRENQAIVTDLDRLGVAGARSADEVRSILRAEVREVPQPPAPPEDLSIYRPTATAQLLDDIAREARGRGQLPGYRDGHLFDENGRVHADILAWLRPRLGDEVTAMLAYYSEARARNLATPGLQGARDSATAIGRAIRDARERGNFPAETRGESEALLDRLYAAVRQDISVAARRSGPEGEVYADLSERVDAAYRELMRNVRQPLGRIMGENVDPVAAIGQLVRATQAGGDMRLLRAFYRVVEEKGTRELATSLLLHNMAEGGLAGFLRSYRGLSEDARRLMFAGGARELGARLDILARAGGRLEAFLETSRPGYMVNPTRWLGTGNLTLGVLYHASLPALITTAAGMSAASRILSSRAFGRWLRHVPVERGPLSEAWSRHGSRLRAILTEDLGLNETAAAAVVSAVSPARAEAAAPLQDRFERPAPRRRNAGKGSIEEIGTEATGQHNVLRRLVRGLVGAGDRTLEDTSRDAQRLVRGDPTMTDEEKQNLVGSIGFGGTVIGRVGAANLAAAGRPTAERVLRLAQRMERDGRDIREIRRSANRVIATEDPRLGGLVRLPDGQWGIEIANDRAVFTPPPRSFFPHLPGPTVRLSQVFRDPEIDAAYPRLGSTVDVTFNPSLRSSQAFGPGMRGPGSPAAVEIAPQHRNIDTALHEVEHLAQVIERFPIGANSQWFADGGPLAHMRLPNERPVDTYMRALGEYLARRAERPNRLTPEGRGLMTGVERRARPLNIPEGLLIFYDPPGR